MKVMWQDEVDGTDVPSGHGRGRPTEDGCAGGRGRPAGNGYAGDGGRLIAPEALATINDRMKSERKVRTCSLYFLQGRKTQS